MYPTNLGSFQPHLEPNLVQQLESQKQFQHLLVLNLYCTEPNCALRGLTIHKVKDHLVHQNGSGSGLLNLDCLGGKPCGLAFKFGNQLEKYVHLPGLWQKPEESDRKCRNLNWKLQEDQMFDLQSNCGSLQIIERDRLAHLQLQAARREQQQIRRDWETLERQLQMMNSVLVPIGIDAKDPMMAIKSEADDQQTPFLVEEQKQGPEIPHVPKLNPIRVTLPEPNHYISQPNPIQVFQSNPNSQTSQQTPNHHQLPSPAFQAAPKRPSFPKFPPKYDHTRVMTILELTCTEPDCKWFGTSDRGLDRHMFLEHKKQVHRCLVRQCSRSFSSLHELKEHSSRHHRGQKKCSRCYLTYPTAEKLGIHYRQCHLAGRFMCIDCKAVFSCRGDVYKHRAGKDCSTKR